MNRSKMLIVDDHSVFREGLTRIINQEKDLAVCGEAADAATALKFIPTLKPDLVITDIALDGMNGIDLAKTIRERFSAVRILVLSMHKESLYAERALRSGANGYITKRESGAQVLAAIRRVLNGQTYISDDFNERLLQRLASTGRTDVPSVETLSDREFEVFQRIGEGYGTRQIAEDLHLSMKTVETHREHIREKLSVNNTFELVQYAIHWVHHEGSSPANGGLTKKSAIR